MRSTWIAFLAVVVLLSFLTPAITVTQSSNLLSNHGVIDYSSEISVSVNFDIPIAVNNLSLGISLGEEWQNWTSLAEIREKASSCNFPLVRIHDLFMISKGLGPCTHWDETIHKGTYNWTSFDNLIESIYAIGAEPMICLGHYAWTEPRYPIIPPGMAVNPGSGLPYPSSFAAYCGDVVEHLNESGRQLKYLEIWNEPESYIYESSDQANMTRLVFFIQLHNAVSETIKRIDPQVLIGTDIGWFRAILPRFLEEVKELDFLCFHKYDSWTTSPPYALSDDQLLEKASIIGGDSKMLSVDEMRQVSKLKRGIELPVFCTETNLNSQFSPWSDPRIHQILGAVWYAEELRAFILEGIECTCYYCFASSNSGQGMVNILNPEDKWYPYLAQHLIGGNLDRGDPTYNSTSSNPSDISVLAWTHGSQCRILLIGKKNTNTAIEINLIGINQSSEATLSRLDNSKPEIQNETINLSRSMCVVLEGYSIVLLSFPTS